MVIGWAGYDGRRSLDRSSHDVCFGGRYVVCVWVVVVVVVVSWLCMRRGRNICSLRCGLGGLSIGRQFGRRTRTLLPCDSPHETGARDQSSLASVACASNRQEDHSLGPVSTADVCRSIGCYPSTGRRET